MITLKRLEFNVKGRCQQCLTFLTFLQILNKKQSKTKLRIKLETQPKDCTCEIPNTNQMMFCQQLWLTQNDICLAVFTNKFKKQ